jgi:hypothetical protein
MAIKRIGSLEIEEQALKPNPILWKLQTFTYFILILILIAALFGLTGYGILGLNIVGNKNSNFWIEYDKFGREDALTTIRVHSDSGILAINNRYLNNIYIKQITPTPLFTEVQKDKIIYHFRALENSPLLIQILLEPIEIGNLTASFSSNTRTLAFKQFIFP